MTIKVIVDEKFIDTWPNYNNWTSFTIVIGKHVLPDIEVYGVKKLKEELKAF